MAADLAAAARNSPAGAEVAMVSSRLANRGRPTVILAIPSLAESAGELSE
jgi:hypothetical protein